MIGRKKKNKQKRVERKKPMEPSKTVSQLHPQRAENPGKKYFTRRKIDTLPGHEQEDYFTRSTLSSRKERLGG